MNDKTSIVGARVESAERRPVGGGAITRGGPSRTADAVSTDRRSIAKSWLFGTALVLSMMNWTAAVPAQTSTVAGSPAGDDAANRNAAASGSAQMSAAEPNGYRMDDYRAPVPATLTGGTVVETEAAKALHDAGVPFVDVLPRAPRPKGLPAGTIWRPKPRHDIPGSVWLVDTGYGELAPIMNAYLMEGLAKATGNDKSRPVVFYCQRDCWMSYNAAKRAISAGYSAVNWYPDGTDGWAEAGYKLVLAEPVTRPDE